MNEQHRSGTGLTGELRWAVLAPAAKAEGQRIPVELVDPLRGHPLTRAVLVGGVDLRGALAGVDLQRGRPALLVLVQAGPFLALEHHKAILHLLFLPILAIERSGHRPPSA